MTRIVAGGIFPYVSSMRDPLQRLKYLPWLELFQVAALTTLIVTVLDIILIEIILTLLSRWLISLSIFAAAIGIGALAVYLMERFFRQIYINTAILWALIFCLALLLWIKSYLPIRVFLTGMGYPQLIGIILGVSLKGRRYWR